MTEILKLREQINIGECGKIKHYALTDQLKEEAILEQIKASIIRVMKFKKAAMRFALIRIDCVEHNCFGHNLCVLAQVKQLKVYYENK